MDEEMGVEQARGDLGRLVDRAHMQSEWTVLTKGNSKERRAVIVSYEWYRAAETRLAMLKEKP